MFAFPLQRSLSLWFLGFWAYATCASIQTANGTVHGVVDNEHGVEKFLGVPFAEPPIGDLRLRQAVPLKQPFDTFEADSFGPSCISVRDQGEASEDCLTLNIWRPIAADRGNASLPVLVWLYGGSLTGGYTVRSFPDEPNSFVQFLITHINRPTQHSKVLLWHEFLARLEVP